MEKLTRRAFGKDTKFTSYTVIMKADSGLDVEWPPIASDFFDSDYDRFDVVSSAMSDRINSLGWY